jgi:hypothetical protein
MAMRSVKNVHTLSLCTKILIPLQVRIHFQVMVNAADTTADLSQSQPRSSVLESDGPLRRTKHFGKKFILKGKETSLSVAFVDIPSHLTPRMKLVDEIVARVKAYRIIQVRGTPASGKTTVMQLVANKLLEVHGHELPIYVLSGWDKETVQAAGRWDKYLMQQTGVSDASWPNHPACLLLDEAQQSYWDSVLWAEFFKSIDRVNVRSPFVVLFSSYGSPSRGNAGFDQQTHIKTPMIFASDQVISMRPNECIGPNLPILMWSDGGTSLYVPRPLGLLLEEYEAIDVMERYILTIGHPSPPLAEDLKKELFLISDGHVGVLRALLVILKEVKVSIPRNLQSRRSMH